MASTTTAPNGPLAQLPPEMLVRVASFLTTAELGPLRRASKAIESKLFVEFAREFFTKRQFMVEHESLEALLGISKHPGLASRLTEVIIGTHILDETPELISNRIRTGHFSRDTLVDTGLAQDMLVEVFSRLPNLKTVGLRDYNGNGRIRDGEHARWRSWGWSLCSTSHTSHSSPSRLFRLLISALAKANARPSSFEVFLRHSQQLTPGSFHLLNDASYNAALAGLKTLMLAISMNDGTFKTTNWNTTLAPWEAYDDANITETPLRQFLHRAVNLEVLRLNFASDESMGHRIIEWLGRPTSAATATATLQLGGLPIPTVQFRSLKSLELGRTNVSIDSLLRVLTKFVDLESFSLHRVTLHSPGPNSLSQDCWSQFLSQLSASLSWTSCIRIIMIGLVSQFHYNQAQSAAYGQAPRVSFVKEGTDPMKKADAAKMTAITFDTKHDIGTVQQWLKDMSELTFVPGIHSTPSPDIVELSDSEDEDADDDEEGMEDEMMDDEDDE